jgi:hypothetical protein
MHQHWLYLSPPSFMLHAFSLLQYYMVRHYHFLSLWHVKRAWQKQACIEIKNLALHNNVLQEIKEHHAQQGRST